MVLDLMIHDIDLIQTLVGEPLIAIEAVGAPVFSRQTDITNSRLSFLGGCVANVTASRISMKQERKIRIFQDDSYLSIDMQQKLLTVIRKNSVAAVQSPAEVSIEEVTAEPRDALLAEIESFLTAVQQGRRPVVCGEDGLRALETALRISELVSEQALQRVAAG